MSRRGVSRRCSFHGCRKAVLAMVSLTVCTLWLPELTCAATAQRESSGPVFRHVHVQAEDDALTCLRLGQIFEHGTDKVTRDPAQAFYWLQRAVEGGNDDAALYLGWLYYTGRFAAPVPGLALFWWGVAASHGNAAAQYHLGLIFMEGADMESDPAEAALWWSQAAKQGHAGAEFNLGLLYLQGQGVEMNPEQALRLWRRSAKKGFPNAVQLLKRMQVEVEQVRR